MGQLLDFPFDPTVWGTAAAWFGAIGTTSAFLLGLGVYRRDAKLRRYEQAIMVRTRWTSSFTPRETGWFQDNLVVEIRNTSDKAIYEVGGTLRRKPLDSFIVPPHYQAPVPEDGQVIELRKEQALEEFRRTEEDWAAGTTLDLIEPNETGEIRFKKPFTNGHILSVRFVDAQNQTWEIVETTGDIISSKSRKLVHVRHDGLERLMKQSRIMLHLLTPPHKTVRFYVQRLKLRVWAFRNGYWGPGVEGWSRDGGRESKPDSQVESGDGGDSAPRDRQ